MKNHSSLKAALSIGLVSLFSGCDDTDVVATLLSGPIDEIPEELSEGPWAWGDSYNRLCEYWSLSKPDESAWFYGTEIGVNVDVYVLAAPNDPLDVVAAEYFEYSKDPVLAQEGDTVFFRGTNGYFGAWVIEDVQGNKIDGGSLTGTWYYQSNGGGNFTEKVNYTGENVQSVDLSKESC